MRVHSKWVGNVLRFFAGTAYPTLLDIDGDNGCVDLKAVKINGTLVSATAAELNKNAGVAAGTASASKAAVLGASQNLDVLGLPVGGLKIGAAGAEVPVTATAANLNAVPTATGTGLEIDAQTKDVLSSASTLALSASAAVQTCTITAKDADGNTVAAVQHVRVYLSTDAAGITLAGAANGAVAPTTGTVLKIQTAKLDWDLLTSAGGVIVLSIDNTGGADHYAVYVNVVLPNGKIKTSLVTDVRAA